MLYSAQTDFRYLHFDTIITCFVNFQKSVTMSFMTVRTDSPKTLAIAKMIQRPIGDVARCADSVMMINRCMVNSYFVSLCYIMK